MKSKREDKMKDVSQKNVHLQLFSPNNEHIGHFDGEFFYPAGVLPYRVDGNEIYTTKMPAEYIGDFEEGRGVSLTGDILFFVNE